MPEANLELVRRGLVLCTFGNASAIPREDGFVVIKPSGVPYDVLQPEHMVISDLSGRVVEGDLGPSSNLATHLFLYRSFSEIGGVAQTHSEYATAWAQAQKPIPCLGTTHADYVHGTIPVTAPLTDEDIASEYEENTGHAIVRCLRQANTSAAFGVLVAMHGPFAWGMNARDAVHHAVVLEALARMAYFTVSINPVARPVGTALQQTLFPQAWQECLLRASEEA